MYSRNTTRFGAAALLIGAALLTPALARAQDPSRPPTPPPGAPTSPTSPSSPGSSTTPTPKTGSASGSVASPLTPASACTITVTDPIHAGAPSVVVQASLSSAIGDSISASFPMTSKIEVVSVAPAGATNAVRLTLNTSEAMPGDYTVSLKGTKGECSGKVKLAANH